MESLSENERFSWCAAVVILIARCYLRFSALSALRCSFSWCRRLRASFLCCFLACSVSLLRSALYFWREPAARVPWQHQYLLRLYPLVMVVVVALALAIVSKCSSGKRLLPFQVIDKVRSRSTYCATVLPVTTCLHTQIARQHKSTLVQFTPIHLTDSE